MNLSGISKLSKDRLLDELKKIIKLNTLEKLSNDKFCLELILLIFPEFNNIKIFSKLNSIKKNYLKQNDFIFLISLMLISENDNTDYFLYKFNISKKNQKRIKIIDSFYKDKVNSQTFTENNMNKVFYFDGKQAVLDVLKFRIIKSKNLDKKLIELYNNYENKMMPTLPIGADLLMKKYKIPKGKQLGDKLRMIEKEWVSNNFKISDLQVDKIVNN
jgi:tRNA nucleotidyltransferase/poly(A) polymerase